MNERGVKVGLQSGESGTYVTPVCGERISSRFAVHHHFLFIRIQRKNNIVWLLDENRPKLFTFYERYKR